MKELLNYLCKFFIYKFNMKWGEIMKKFSKVLLIMGLIMMIMSQSVMADSSTVSSEVKRAESPSAWAIWDIQMSNVYNLGTIENYKNYTNVVISDQFLAIEESFESRFNVTDESKLSKDVNITRGNVVEEFYDIIQATLELENLDGDTKNEALTYFIDQGLINGRGNDNYALEDECTNQEMLVLAKRVYDHLIYSLELDAKGAFWTVNDEDNTVYLLGSIHATDGSVYPMSKEILDAFNSSSALAVEANILSPSQEDTAYIQQIMMLEGDTTIDQLISEDTYKKYVEILSPYGIAPEVYNKLKPWYGAMVVQNLQMANQSYNAAMGVDLYFLSMATGRKSIIELEGIKYQIDMFDSFSAELQEGYLMSVLEGEEASNDLMGQMLKDWKSGDMEDLEQLVFAETEEESELEKEFNEKLWDVRNAHMVEKVLDMLEQDSENDYFLVVGAGHMLNDNGIVESLRNLGYEVEQVK